MGGLIIKLITIPIAIFLAIGEFPGNLYFRYPYQVILAGIVIAIVGFIPGLIVRGKHSVWLRAVINFLTAAILIYLSSLAFAGVKVTLAGALIVAFLVALAELALHFYFGVLRK